MLLNFLIYVLQAGFNFGGISAFGTQNYTVPELRIDKILRKVKCTSCRLSQSFASFIRIESWSGNDCIFAEKPSSVVARRLSPQIRVVPGPCLIGWRFVSSCATLFVKHRDE